MENLILFFLATCGFTLIVTKSYLFRPLREYINKKNKNIGKLISCQLCFGWWASIAIFFLPACLLFLKYAFAGSFVCYLAYLLMEDLVKKHD